jgi:hypothetical protein
LKYFKFMFILFSYFIFFGCSTVGGNDKEMRKNRSSKEDEQSDKDGIDSVEGEEIIFLDLEYVGAIENADFSVYYKGYKFDDELEFTWWMDLRTDFKESQEYVLRTHNVDIPYFETNGRRIVISLGRKLKDLYYYEESKYGTYNGRYIGRPIFEKEYFYNTLFIYTMNEVSNFGFDNETCTEDMRNFNSDGDVPYEVRPFESMGAMGVFPEDRPFQK